MEKMLPLHSTVLADSDDRVLQNIGMILWYKVRSVEKTVTRILYFFILKACFQPTNSQLVKKEEPLFLNSFKFIRLFCKAKC